MITSSMFELIFFDSCTSFIIALRSLSFVSAHLWAARVFLAISCIAESSVAFIILPTFLIHASSICLTLSLVIAGLKEFPIL